MFCAAAYIDCQLICEESCTASREQLQQLLEDMHGTPCHHIDKPFYSYQQKQTTQSQNSNLSKHDSKDVTWKTQNEHVQSDVKVSAIKPTSMKETHLLHYDPVAVSMTTPSNQPIPNDMPPMAFKLLIVVTIIIVAFAYLSGLTLSRSPPRKRSEKVLPQ